MAIFDDRIQKRVAPMIKRIYLFPSLCKYRTAQRSTMSAIMEDLN